MNFFTTHFTDHSMNRVSNELIVVKEIPRMETINCYVCFVIEPFACLHFLFLLLLEGKKGFDKKEERGGHIK